MQSVMVAVLLEKEYLNRVKVFRKNHNLTYRKLFEKAFENFIGTYKKTKNFQFKYIHFERLKVNPISFHVRIDVKEQINLIAKEHNLTQGKVTREILIRFLKK